MNAPDRALVEQLHRAQAATLRRERRSDDVENRVRRKLIDEAKQPGTRAHTWLIEYRADQDCDITAVAFIALAEAGKWDLWLDAWLQAKKSDAFTPPASFVESDIEECKS